MQNNDAIEGKNDQLETTADLKAREMQTQDGAVFMNMELEKQFNEIFGLDK